MYACLIGANERICFRKLQIHFGANNDFLEQTILTGIISHEINKQKAYTWIKVTPIQIRRFFFNNSGDKKKEQNNNVLYANIDALERGNIRLQQCLNGCQNEILRLRQYV